MKLDDTFEFGILEIRDLGFSVDERLTAEHPEDWMASMEISFSKESNWVEIIVVITFRDDKQRTMGQGTVLNRFFVQDLTQYFSTNQRYILTLPNDYDLTLFSLSYTHTRAILAKNFAGTKYSNIFLPLVNPQEFFLQFRAQRETNELKVNKRKLKANTSKTIT